MNGHFIFYLKKIAQKIQEPKTNKKPKTCENRHPKKKKKKEKKKRKEKVRHKVSNSVEKDSKRGKKKKRNY